MNKGKFAPSVTTAVAVVIAVALLSSAHPRLQASDSVAGPAYDPAVTALDVPEVATIQHSQPQTIKVTGTFANEGTAVDTLTVTIRAHYNLDFEASWIGTTGDTVQNGVFDGDFHSELSFTEAGVEPGGAMELSRDLVLRCPAPNFNFVMYYYVVMSVTSTSGMDSEPKDSSMTEYRNVMCSDSTPIRSATVTPTPSPSPTPPAKHCGDANFDGLLDAIDAQLVLQYVAGLVPTLNGLASADTNANGSIDSVDALLILQYVARLIDEKGCA